MEKVSELKEKPDLIILDHPRDLPIFEERGYNVKKIKCMDMFIPMEHAEVITLIARKNEP